MIQHFALAIKFSPKQERGTLPLLLFLTTSCDHFDMSKTYEHTGQMTEWDDILIKKGITTRDAVLESRGLNPDDVKSRLANSFTSSSKLICASSCFKLVSSQRRSHRSFGIHAGGTTRSPQRGSN